MKKILGLLAIVLTISSCTQVNSSGEKNVTQGEDTIADVDISLSKMDVVEELANIKEDNLILLKASGSEPGWFAEFYSTRIRLVVDYGKDSLLFDRKNDDLSKDNVKIQFGKSDEMTIIKKACTNAAGDVTDRTVSLTYKGKKYQGCGILGK